MTKPSTGSGPSRPTAELSAALADLATRPLPAEVVDAAVTVVLDGIGCLVAGSAELAGRIAASHAASGGSREATIIGAGALSDVGGAAFANGVALHCLDYEAIGSPPCHGTSYILPAVLALAERDGAAGEDVLRAFALGWDVECRLRTIGALRPGLHPSGIYGPVAAAAACASLLRLDAGRTEHAIGAAASASAGLIANVPTMSKATHAGNAARAGVQAALMAAQGFTATSEILAHPRGFVASFTDGAPDWRALNQDWGDRYFLVDPGVNLKRYPVQNPLQTVVSAVLDARPHGLTVDDLEAVEIIGPRHLTAKPVPEPEDGHAGKFSAEYCAAVALLDGDVGLSSFGASAWTRTMESAVIDRVRLTEGRVDGGKHAVAVHITTRAGETFSSECAHYRGSLKDPMTQAERHAKVRDCFGHAGTTSVVDEVMEVVERLPEMSDVGELLDILRGVVVSSR